MKKTIKILFSVVFVLSMAFVSSCSSDKEDENEPGGVQSAKKAILEFSIGERQATIDEEAKTIKISLPYGTAITKLAPVVKISEKATVSPISGSELDFTTDVIYTVTAEDKSVETYTASVTVDKNSDASIQSFVFESLSPRVSGLVDEKGKTITVSVPYATDVAALTPTVAFKGEKLFPASKVTADFTKPVEYTVTAENGTANVYTVTVNRITNSESNILTFKLEGIEADVKIDHNAGEILALVPYGTDVHKLTPIITFQGKEIKPLSEIEQDFFEPIKYTVTATDETKKKYNVTVEVEFFDTKITQVFGGQAGYQFYPGEAIQVTGKFAEDNNEVELRSADHPVSLIDIEKQSTTLISGRVNTVIAPGEYTLSVKSNGTSVKFETAKITILDPTLPVINLYSNVMDNMVAGYESLTIVGRNVAGVSGKGPVKIRYRMDGESDPYKIVDGTNYISKTSDGEIYIANTPTKDVRVGKQYISIVVHENVSNEESLIFKPVPPPTLGEFVKKEGKIGNSFEIRGSYLGVNMNDGQVIEVSAYNEASGKFEVVDKNAMIAGHSLSSFRCQIPWDSWGVAGTRVKFRIQVGGIWSNMTEGEGLVIN